MGNFFLDNDDLRFYFDRAMPWDALVAVTELGQGDGAPSVSEAVAGYRDVLELVGELAADEIAPHALRLDREGVRFEGGEAIFPPTLARIFDKLREIELHRMCLPRELGGMNCPFSLYMLSLELFARADAAVMTHYGFHLGIAMALLLFSVREGSTTFDPEARRVVSTRWAEAIEEISSGAAWGSMDITEPDAGSDMAALRTRAELGADGVWRVTGQKIFITSGHGKYHFVIARTDGAAPKRGTAPGEGLDGLSMFLVKAYDDGPEGRVRHAHLAGVEEKLGHHASATATVVFDETPAELVGEVGEGFRYMLTMMNNARIGVGFEALGVCEASYRAARAYAAERWSMGKPIGRHELIADMLDEMKTDIAGIRALAVEACVGEELTQKLELEGLMLGGGGGEGETREREREIARHKRRTRAVTPLLKYLAAEKAVEMARRAMQIHGGVGYIRETGVEKLLRDAAVLPIYEGTSQIQALMAMKDQLSAVLKAPQDFLRRVAQARLRSVSARDPLERRVARLTVLCQQAIQRLVTRTASEKLSGLRGRPVGSWLGALRGGWDPKRDFAFALLHAERLTRMLADEAIARALFRQQARFPERRPLLVAHLERAEPRARFLLDQILTTGERLLDQLAADDPQPSERATA